MEKDNFFALENICEEFERNHIQRFLEMEIELLGMTLLKGGKCVPVICQYLTTDDFIDTQHSTIFKAVTALHSQGTAPDLNLIINWLTENNYRIYYNGKDLENVGGIGVGSVSGEKIIALGRASYSDAQAESYAQKLAEAALKRKMLKNKVQGIRKIFDDTLKSNDILNLDQQVIDDFTGRSQTKKFENIGDFLTGKNNDITKSKLFQYFDQFQTFANRKSGFGNFDAVQIFAPSVQIIGGTPGAGKTTFCWQLLNQFAERGETCLYFSFEMSAAEMFIKTLTRELFKLCTVRNLPSFNSVSIRKDAVRDILGEGEKNPLYRSARAFIDDILPNMSQKYKNLHIYECKDETIDDVLRLIRSYCQDGKTPIVCIDYLQLINPTDPKLTESDNLKIVMKELKRFSTTTNTTFIVISALNRESYSGGDTLKGFRGTSAIEFSCDAAYLMNINFDPKVESAESAMRKKPREIKIKCLKNRFGNAFEIYFDYHSAYDYFEAVDNADIANAADDITPPVEDIKSITEDDIDIPEF